MTMKQKLFAVALVLSAAGHLRGQAILSIDIVRINAKYEAEAIYFYEQNWKAFREDALRQGVISGYNILRDATDSTGHFSIVLITEYPDSALFKARESNFAPIMKKLSPGGPRLLNNISAKAFAQYFFGLDARSVLHRRTRMGEE